MEQGYIKLPYMKDTTESQTFKPHETIRKILGNSKIKYSQRIRGYTAYRAKTPGRPIIQREHQQMNLRKMRGRQIEHQE